MYLNCDNVQYFDSFRVEDIPKEIKKFIGNKNIATIIYRIQANDSITSRKSKKFEGKSLLDYNNLFSPNEYQINDKIILKYF